MPATDPFEDACPAEVEPLQPEFDFDQRQRFVGEEDGELP